jgi:tRNA (guanine-N7-)-methyltransferase
MAKPYLSLKPLVPWLQMGHPLDWPALFGRRAPLLVEIGFGNGERLVRRALARPENDLVGVDVSWPAVRRTLRKISLAGAANVRLVQAQAPAALERLFAPGGLAGAEALFPCPWPAARHQKRRLFCRRHLEVLNSRLAMGACFRLVTDLAGYRDWVRGQARGLGFSCQTRSRAPGLGTKYERKWRAAGQENFHELVLTKTRHHPVAPPEEVEMEAITLAEFRPERLTQREIAGEAHIAFRELVYDPQRGKALWQTVVNEEGFVQAFWLEFARLQRGWVARLSLGCPVAPTRGVRRALALAAELAQGREPA